MSNAKILFLIACISFANSGKLPSNINVCKRSDPNISECFKNAVQDALPKLRNGLPEIGFSPIEPFEISFLSIDAGSESMKVVQTYKNMKIYNLTNSVINAAKLENDGENFYAEFQVTIPLVKAESDYSIDGKLLMLPIKGEGQCQIVFKDSKAVLKMNGTKLEKNGKLYLKVNEFKVSFEPNMAQFQFDHLFNDDQKLGDAMNMLINENWRSLFDEVRDAYEETFAQLFKDTTNSIFTKVPVDELFPQ